MQVQERRPRHAADRSTTWILAGQLIDGTGRAVRKDMAIRLDGDLLGSLRPLDEFAPDPADRIVDHRDATVAPGLIDSHTHLTFNHAPDSPTIRAMVERAGLPTLTLLAARNAQACLLAGITTIRDCGDRGFVTLAVRDAVERGWLAGPRIQAAGPPITTSGGHLSWCGRVADTSTELRAAVQDLCAAGVDLIKVVASGGNMTPGSDPFQPQYSAADLRALVDEAHRLGRPVAAHAINAEAVRRCVEAGVDTIEHCLWNGPDGEPAFDPTVARRIAERGPWIGVNMAGVDRILLPSDGDPSASARGLRRLRDRWAAAREMHRLGARIMVSSDAGTRYARFEDFALSLVCAVAALDLDPIEAIHRATQVPAEALGLDREIGTVEPGKRADLLIAEGNPARDVADLARVRQVWQSGQVVFDRSGVRPPKSEPAIVPEADRP